MTYRIEVLPAAVREIRKLPSEAKRRVQAVIELLSENPRPPAATKLTARPEWRVRTGDYRVLYRIEDTRPFLFVDQLSIRSTAQPARPAPPPQLRGRPPPRLPNAAPAGDLTVRIDLFGFVLPPGGPAAGEVRP